MKTNPMIVANQWFLRRPNKRYFDEDEELGSKKKVCFFKGKNYRRR